MIIVWRDRARIEVCKFHETELIKLIGLIMDTFLDKRLDFN